MNDRDLIGREAWILIVNSETKWEPRRVIIRKVRPSKSNILVKEYGVEYERVGRKYRTTIQEKNVYRDKWTATQIASHLNGEY